MIALNATTAAVTLSNTSGAGATNVPFTLGHPFKAGELSPTDGLVGRIAGEADVPLQLNAKTTHADGSLRHAIISGVLPVLAASGSKTMSLVRAASPTAFTPVTPSSVSGITATVTATIGGVAYTASLASLLAGAYATWLSGPIVNEWVLHGPLTTAGGVPHPSLSARFNVRAYAGQPGARVDIAVENSKAVPGSATATTFAVYDLAIFVGGASVYTKNAVVHLPWNRFRKTFWWNRTTPALHIQHDSAYAIGTYAFPNYDPILIGAVSSDQVAAFKTQQSANADLFQSGCAEKRMPNTGGRPDIGLIPAWDLLYLLGMGKDARDVSLTQSALMGGWSTHYRDPVTDAPVSVVDYPYVSGGISGDTFNTITQKSEGIATPSGIAITGISATNPAVVSSPGHPFTNGMSVYTTNISGTMSALNYVATVVANVTANSYELVGRDMTGKTYVSGGVAAAFNINEADTSHEPAVGYVAYLLSGDHFHLEELQFYAMWNIMASWTVQRQYGKGLLAGGQTRHQAWGLRALAQAAYATPDADRLQAHFTTLLNSNLSYYNATYTNNLAANTLGALVGGSAWSDPDSTGNVTRTWQDDFFTQAVGHTADLGFSQALPLLAYKAKYPVSRMLSCPMLAATYSLKLRPDNTSPMYTSITQAYDATLSPEIRATQCGSAQMAALVGVLQVETLVAGDIAGYPTSPTGFPSNMQPALAYAASYGVAGASDAWTLFANRTRAPNYSGLPEFAVVPRSTVATTTPTDPTIPSGTNMPFADRVKTTSTSTGTGNFTVSATPAARMQPLSAFATGTSGVPLVIENESGTDWEESLCTILTPTTFSRDTVIKGSNGSSKVDFAAGTKTVFATITAAQLSSFLTVSSGTPISTYLAANPGSTLSPSDTVLVVQGSAVVGEALSALAAFAISQYPAGKVAAVRITAAGTYPLDSTSHNRRRIIVTVAGVTLIGPNAYGSVGDDFECYVKNLSAAVVTLGAGISCLPAGNNIAANTEANIFSTAGSIFCMLPAAVTASVAPGQVTGLATSSPTSSGLTVSYAAPSTGTAPFSYTIQYRQTGGSAWTTAATGVSALTYAIAGLNPSTGYDTQVCAVNGGGAGSFSTVATGTTAAGALLAPGQATALSAGTPSSTSVPLSWTAPSSGGAVATYTVQYRPGTSGNWLNFSTSVTGTSATVTGLTAATAYQFQIIAVNATASGTASALASATTAAASSGTPGAAPFTATARTGFPITFGTFAGDSSSFLWSDIAATGAATVASVVGILSTSNTVAPTTSIAAPNGRSLGTLSGTTAPYVPGGSLINFAVASPTNYYYWISITDSNGATWNFVHTAPISFGDGVAATRQTGATAFAQVQS